MKNGETPSSPCLTGHHSVDKFLEKTLEIMRVKGHDYRQGNDNDLIHNFRTVSEAVNEPMEKVWFTYFYKHYAALTTYIKNGGQSESEPIEGRISDLIVYLLLFHEILLDKEKKRKENLAKNPVHLMAQNIENEYSKFAKETYFSASKIEEMQDNPHADKYCKTCKGMLPKYSMIHAMHAGPICGCPSDVQVKYITTPTSGSYDPQTLAETWHKTWSNK